MGEGGQSRGLVKSYHNNLGERVDALEQGSRGVRMGSSTIDLGLCILGTHHRDQKKIRHWIQQNSPIMRWGKWGNVKKIFEAKEKTKNNKKKKGTKKLRKMSKKIE